MKLTDDKWWQKLTLPLARWAKKVHTFNDGLIFLIFATKKTITCFCIVLTELPLLNTNRLRLRDYFVNEPFLGRTSVTGLLVSFCFFASALLNLWCKREATRAGTSASPSKLEFIPFYVFQRMTMQVIYLLSMTITPV